ncbi:hypothetical protein PR003_g9086 [Phytophthora rubi]|uniref:Uncharacterized protein n=1 Tax=Phytophthora rubi TaxID=129364 RepID=A0A6A4F9F2_9STRA|nr:hypothetical protein PR003_g9086 [Phytophthora rubi]
MAPRHLIQTNTHHRLARTNGEEVSDAPGDRYAEVDPRPAQRAEAIAVAVAYAQGSTRLGFARWSSVLSIGLILDLTTLPPAVEIAFLSAVPELVSLETGVQVKLEKGRFAAGQAPSTAHLVIFRYLLALGRSETGKTPAVAIVSLLDPVRRGATHDRGSA